MTAERRDELVEHPTYLEHIRYFFDALDIDHMRAIAGMDLGTYEGVKAKASQIYFQTSAGKMPPEAERRWPKNRVTTFRNWMVDKCPLGVSPLDAKALMTATAETGPVRRDAGQLNESEVKKLALAFSTIMGRDPDDAHSYFALAGVHWFPEPTYCLHHEPRYNSWHRVYIDRFESALRSVPGCEDLTLPYWDILKPIPDWLFMPPFDGYTLQRDASPNYKAGFRVSRFAREAIYKNLQEYDVASDIKVALNSANFETFAFAIERAHDSGHVAIGPPTGMGQPDVAAFDPIFWFFHCNWERMWWAWQRRYAADTLDKFRSTLSDQTWLDDAVLNSLEPFGVTSPQTIDASRYAYEDMPTQFSAVGGFVTGNVRIDRAFRLSTEKRVSIRVKDIERLRVPGSFVLHLLGDQKTLAKRAFFQSSEPQNCPNCVRQAKVNIDFVLDRSQIEGRRLEVKIETLDPKRIGPWVPLSQLGAPTINVRELLISQ